MALVEQWKELQARRKQNIEAQHQAIVERYGEDPQFVHELRPYLDFCGGWPEVSTNGQGPLEEACDLWDDAIRLSDGDFLVVGHGGFRRDWEAVKNTISLTPKQVITAENCFYIATLGCLTDWDTIALELLPVLCTVRDILYGRHEAFAKLMEIVGKNNREATRWLRERSLEELKMLLRE